MLDPIVDIKPDFPELRPSKSIKRSEFAADCDTVGFHIHKYAEQ